MSDQLSQDQRAARGAEAERLLKSELLSEAFELATQRFTAEWINATDVIYREAAWAKVRALAEVRSVLHAVLVDGAFAAKGR